RQQAIERAKPLRRRPAAAGQPIDPLSDHLIDADERYDVLHSGNSDAKLALEPAGSIDGQRSGAEQRGVAARKAQGFDFDAATGRLQLTKQNRPRLGLEVLEPAHDRIDLAG